MNMTIPFRILYSRSTANRSRDAKDVGIGSTRYSVSEKVSVGDIKLVALTVGPTRMFRMRDLDRSTRTND